MKALEASEKGLLIAKQVIERVLKDKEAELVFGQPVDAVAWGLPDYFDIIKKPMDLGTILQKLEAGGQKGRGSYLSVSQVLGDVNLIWENCYTYNNRPVDWETRKICDRVKALFEKEWEKAGQKLEGQPSRKKQQKLETAEKAVEQTENPWMEEDDVPLELTEQSGKSSQL